MSEEETPKPVDLYRDTPVRYLGYANEVGEAFRNMVHKNVVRFSYLISGGYVVADATSKSSSSTTPIRTFADVLIWQGLASVAIPGFTINRLCWAVGKMVGPARTAVVTGTGLLAIPFIIKPIDAAVDHGMERVVRPYILDNVNC